jgi:hypothetical protein
MRSMMSQGIKLIFNRYKLFPRVIITVLTIILTLTGCQNLAFRQIENSSHPPVRTPEEIAQLRTEIIANNYLGSQTQGDVKVEILRLSCRSTDRWLAETGIPEPWFPVVFGKAPTLCLIFLEITNTSNQKRVVYPESVKNPAQAAIESDLLYVPRDMIFIVDTSNNMKQPLMVSGAGEFDSYGGEILPNTSYITGYYFSVPEISWNTMSKLIYTIDPPLDANGDPVGEKFLFEVKISSWEYAPLPDELVPILLDWNVDI